MMRCTIMPNGDLLIQASNTERSDLAYSYAQGGHYRAEGHVSECLRDCFTFIQPEAIGALTTAPILTDDADWSDEVMERYNGPVPHVDANVYWFPNYQITDPWETLKNTGRVIFTRASSEKEV